jgi:hypothetical protein
MRSRATARCTAKRAAACWRGARRRGTAKRTRPSASRAGKIPCTGRTRGQQHGQPGAQCADLWRGYGLSNGLQTDIISTVGGAVETKTDSTRRTETTAAATVASSTGSSSAVLAASTGGSSTLAVVAQASTTANSSSGVMASETVAQMAPVVGTTSYPGPSTAFASASLGSSPELRARRL